MPMARLSRLLLLLCSFLPVAGNSAIELAAIDMELSAGLGGQAVAGRATEIEVRLFATSPQTAELQIRDANGYLSVPITLQGQVLKQLWLPVTPEPLSPLRVRLSSSSGEVIEKELNFEHGHVPLSLVSRSVPAYRAQGSHQRITGVRPVIVPAESLPRSLQAYAGVHAIVTDVESLSNLTIEQSRAFANYLSGCNILLLATASPALLERVRSLSGCSGKYIQSYQTLAQVSELLRELDARLPLKPPSAQNMLALRFPAFQDSMVTSLSLYLAAYIALMALLCWQMQKTNYLLILPVIAAGAGILAWTGSGSAQLISWAESQSDDSHLRVSSLLLLGGDRRGEKRLTHDADVSITPANSIFNRKTRHDRMRHLDDRSRYELSVHTTMLAPAAYQLTSVARQAPVFTLQLEQGIPQLVYHAESAINQARLLWRGYTYGVPPLAKGESWQPHETEKRLVQTAAEKLLQRHLEFESPALLLPFGPGPQSVAADDIQGQGWLVIRHNPGQTP